MTAGYIFLSTGFILIQANYVVNIIFFNSCYNTLNVHIFGRYTVLGCEGEKFVKKVDKA